MKEVYIVVLTYSYSFWNSVRILSYFPTILKLRRADADAGSYSQVTWVCWIFANLTYCLMLFHSKGNHFDALVAVPFSNVVFCSITSFYIWRLQRRDPDHENDFIHLFKDTLRELSRGTRYIRSRLQECK